MIKATQKIFEADSESLYDFVSKNGRGLYIPPYQREYAWTKDNVERLIADTVQGIAAFLKSPDESITFLGTIIAMNDAKKSTIDPVVKNQVYSQVMTIIDGQQRLTTLLMMCLVLLAEIKTQWSELRRNQAAREENTVGWLETRINDVLGLLSQMLSEEQRNGEGEFRYFPKMIRAFKDKWSYEADKATYSSPIAWVIFEYQKFNKTKDPQWNTFIDQLARSANARGAEPELANFVKLMKAMRSKLRALPNDEDFMDFLTISHDVEKQEALFDEEFPAEMKAGLLLAAASGEAVEGAPEVDRRARKWWSNVNSLLALLFFSKFALERITLVVVTATTEDFAFDVFEALNTTGQPLTALETFTPKVVQTIGIQNYNASPEKKYMDAAFSYLKKISGNGDKQKSSSELIVAFALAERGEKQSKNLADQRRFMRLTFEAFKNRDEQKEFIRHLADLTKFLDETFVDQGAPVISGIQLPADVSLCIRFLVELGHTITAPLLAQYAAVITDDLDQEDRVAAIEQFGAVTKAVTAFAVFWRSSRMNQQAFRTS